MSREGYRLASVSTMPSFDIVSEVDRQELRNAVDQAQREMVNRFDFKNTNSDIEQKELIITIRTISEEKARAVRVLLEEKFVKRGLSLKGIDWGKFEQASGDTVRQVVTIAVGISSDKAREINKLIKEKGPKGISSQTQGEQVRVTGKKRDDLQAVMALLKSEDLGVPLQFENFRDYRFLVFIRFCSALLQFGHNACIGKCGGVAQISSFGNIA